MNRKELRADYDAAEWCVIVLAGALAICSGLWWLSPSVAWYVGISGVLHTVMAAGAAKHFFEGAWDRWLLMVLLGDLRVRNQELTAAGYHAQVHVEDRVVDDVDPVFAEVLGQAQGSPPSTSRDGK